MKAIFLALSLCYLNSTFATNYYFSSESGNDSRSASQAKDPSTPWKSIGKLNSIFSTLVPGDAVLFKRGETFYGSIKVNKSGTSGAPIIIGAYGTGNNPVITLLQSLGGFSSKGSGIWESSTVLNSTVNMVLINGVQYGMGRYPNKDAEYNGYLNFESHNGKTSITDKQLNTSVNWKGAEVVIRPRHWILTRSAITSNTSSTISYSGTSPYEPYENYGYFIQNSIKTLDKFGEWYYNPGTKKLSAHFGSNNPSSFSVQAATSGDLVSSLKFSYVKFQNLTFRGANGCGFNIQSGSHISIENCNILFSGQDGIYVKSHTNLSVQNCTISDQNNNGIDIESGDNAVIRNNKIVNSYLVAGMGRNGEGMGIGINIFSSNGMVEYNEIRNSGYSGIYYNGYSITIKNNLIDNFCIVKDDGGGIYSTSGSTVFTGRKVIGNIILNGKGIGFGTNMNAKLAAHGIYLDNNAGATLFRDNTVANCANNGFNIHNSATMTMENNTLYNNKIQVNMVQDADNAAIRNCVLTGNIMFSKLKDQWVTMMIASGNDIKSFGKFDNNVYARPIDNNVIIYTKYYYQTSHDVDQNFTLAGWKSKYGMDMNSRTMARQLTATSNPADYIRFDYNASTSNKTINLGGTYEDARGVKYSSSVTLKPYSSIVLLKTSGTIGNLAPAVTITNPVTNSSSTANSAINITADASDDDAVAKVEFYNGSTLLGSDNTSPYTHTWNSVPAGKYTLTAKATDNKGVATTSTPVSITVGSVSNGAPVISLTSPQDNAGFNSPASINITASASDAGGSVTKVEFYNGSSLIGTDQTSPYSVTWNNVGTGNYTLTAKVTDNSNATTISSPVSISVGGSSGSGSPLVSITSPQNNANFAPSSTVTVTADASDNDGSIAKVEFYRGSTLLKTEYTAPYRVTLNNVAEGSYNVTAKAYDNSSKITTSSPVTFTVGSSGENGGPIVSILKLAESGTVAPATIKFEATATDANGTIEKVEFFNGGTLLKTEYTAPYRCSWGNVPAGKYTVVAKATDNDGHVTTSDGVSVTVTGATAARGSSSVTAGGVNQAEPVVNSYQSNITAKSISSGTSNFVLYPNPSVNTLQISMSNISKYQKAGLVIQNASGATVIKQPVSITGSKINIDISSLANGVYTLSLAGNNFVFTQQFVKID